MDNQEIRAGGDSRNSCIEMLRIVSMLLITILHFADHGITVWPDNRIIAILITAMYAGGQVGVACFVLISGYCQRKQTHNWKKTILIIAQVWVYSVLLETATQLFSGEFQPRNMVRACFPILNNEYWFMSSYVGLLMLYPYINVLMDQLSQRQNLQMIGIGTLMFVVHGTVSQSNLWVNNLLWMCYVFSIGGYLARYGIPTKCQKTSVATAAGVYFIYTALYVFGASFLEKIGRRLGILFLTSSAWLIGRYSIFTLAVALILFIAILNLNSIRNQRINRYARYMLSVYLLTMHRRFYAILWNVIFWNDEAVQSYHVFGFVFYMICVLAVIFTACPLIDWIRRITVERKLKQLIGG